jgi:membrane protein YdbS with pleckstrin-like domain
LGFLASADTSEWIDVWCRFLGGATVACMPWPENAMTNDEAIVASFRPHWKLLFVPFLWGAGVFVVFAGLEVAFDGLAKFTGLISIGLLLYFLVRPLVNWWFTRYVLTTERLITRRGLIAQSGIEIPLESITNVNFSQSIFERIVGAGDLLVESAGETGQSSFVNIPRPDRFQALLYKTREARSIDLSTGGPAFPPVEPTEAIRNLANLRDEGLITEQEYERKRLEILEGM